MSHIFPRHTKSPPPVVARGEGVYLFDSTGKAYLDGSGGAAVSCLGHSDAKVVAAMKAQLDQVAFAHTGFFTSEPAERLADRLISLAPKGLDRVYVVAGGSEAMESALKLARQYHLEKGEPQRVNIIARRQSYHGNTLGALATGGNLWRREPFAPLLIDVHHVAPCYAYRGMAPGESEEQYGERLAAEIEAKVTELGPETVMAFVAEPVVGATAGAVPAVPGYFKRIREICDRYGILMILDEVMCGMGRTGTLFACEQDGVAPDICAVAKGLGAGYAPIGAMLCSAEIYAAIETGTGFFQHGHTYLGHPTSCAGACAVLERLVDDGLLGRVAPTGALLRAALEERFGQNPHVGDIRGRGLFLGVELVADRESKTPFDPSKGVAGKLKKAAFAEGLICYPMSGTIDGQNGDHVLLAPPFILSEDQVGELVDKLDKALGAVLG
ncbi:aspartate aminotransferase family protein [Salipiger sp. P9]|uniref:aspartate aminotransferase family protein n=1 Tax=Salipiger pentaromativorans TaxID=2943193 RepID=UPI00215725B6|nr:aspartate aminotransferase family protein [Salipiger pentaromativorans]MCR8549639.1 aspartate aminotransferase family protein [Salipiger pentaromativorans]